jgi:hypothetical protein
MRQLGLHPFTLAYVKTKPYQMQGDEELHSVDLFVITVVPTMTSLQLQSVISALRGLDPYTPVFLAFLSVAATSMCIYGEEKHVLCLWWESWIAASGSSNEIVEKYVFSHKIIYHVILIGPSHIFPLLLPSLLPRASW